MTMKKLLAALTLAAGLSSAAHAGVVPPSYVVTTTFTATNNAKVFAFQNTSSTLDVYIRRIEVANVHDESAITGGMVQYQVFASTSLTHGGQGRIRTFSMTGANASAPSYVTASTGPVSIQYENLTGGSTLPIIKPLFVNTDDGATSNLVDSYEAPGNGEVSPLKLPAGANRAIVIEQHQLAGGAIDTGKIRIAVEYWAR
jgi:hypothetical protein